MAPPHRPQTRTSLAKTLAVADANNDGVADCSGGVGENGYCDELETVVDNGTANYEVADTDGDGSPDRIDLDSDNDGFGLQGGGCQSTGNAGGPAPNTKLPTAKERPEIT